MLDLLFEQFRDKSIIKPQVNEVLGCGIEVGENNSPYFGGELRDKMWKVDYRGHLWIMSAGI